MVGPACGLRVRGPRTVIKEPDQEDVVYDLVSLFRFFTKGLLKDAALYDDWNVNYYDFSFIGVTNEAKVIVLFGNGLSIEAIIDISNCIPAVKMDGPFTVSIWLGKEISDAWLREFQRFVGPVPWNLVEGDDFMLFRMDLNRANLRRLKYLEACLLSTAQPSEWDDPRHPIDVTS